MLKRFVALGTMALLGVCLPSTAYAWKVIGNVYCDANQNGQIDTADTPLANVRLNVVSTDGTFSSHGITDIAGYYLVDLPDFDATYTLTVDLSSLPAGSIVLIPSGGSTPFASITDVIPQINVLVSSPSCVKEFCWMTGGGAKFSPITNTLVAEHGPQNSFGGNVNPGCSPTAGEGGQWNHVAHSSKLHFQGLAIQVVRCGNVPGIPPGSESPQTPFNFIEFSGTGRLTGIAGNKVDYGTIHFWARVEDRNEPGSSGAKDGALIDRYFLHVFANPADPNGSTLLLIDVDGNPATVDPITITDGNLQIHISSCSTPPQ